MEEEIQDRISACGAEGEGDAEKGVVMPKSNSGPDKPNVLVSSSVFHYPMCITIRGHMHKQRVCY